jgi:uncharacterized membrane protein (UPF0127 family)
MNPGRQAGLLATASLLLSLGPAPTVQAIEPADRIAGLDTGTLILETSADRCLRILVYFADTPAQQSQGLMFVTAMDEFEGMLFRYAQPRAINMWMRNTYISLDMLFIRGDQKIGRIAYSTQPFSEERISSGQPISSVLELNAGFASRWQLRAGDRLLLTD